MTNEEMAVAIQQGDDSKLPELWASVEKLVRWKANKLPHPIDDGTGIEFEELVNTGYIAMAKAVRTYKPEKGSFSTWFLFYLQSAFAEVLGYRTERQKNEPIRNSISLDTPLPETDGLTVGDMIADNTDVEREAVKSAWRRELGKALDSAMSVLDDKQATVIHMEYYEEKSFREIGEALGITASAARQLSRKAFERLREPDVVEVLQPFLEKKARKGKKKNAWSVRIQEENLLLSTGNLAERLAALRNSLSDFSAE